MDLALTRLVRRLMEIARKNNDEFRFRIEIDAPRQPQGPLSFNFVCEETADSHTLLNGRGPSIEAAVEAAEADIKDACKSWGYKI